MKTTEFFSNGLSYVSGVEKWCQDFYRKISGKELEFTFCKDFAIADWAGLNEVSETYNRVKRDWLSDYKAFTEVAISLNLLAWANNQLMQQGLEDREPTMNLYSGLYYKAMEDFYAAYEGNDEAETYFFEMTD